MDNKVFEFEFKYEFEFDLGVKNQISIYGWLETRSDRDDSSADKGSPPTTAGLSAVLRLYDRHGGLVVKASAS